MEYGTPEQKARFLPKMASSEEVWCQGWSEPNAGSDMAAIASTAVRDGDHFVINGQKTWASRGAYAHWCFGLFRTDPESSRHKGLSFILTPMDLPGMTVRPIQKINGKAAFAEIFFDDVCVPVENLLGPEGEGWNVAMATAGFERGLMLRSPARFQSTANRLVQLYRETIAKGLPVAPGMRERVAECWMRAEAYCLNTYQTVSKLLAGGKIGAEASLNKIFWSELDVRMHELGLELLGPRAELLPGAPAAGDGVGDWLDGYIFALSGPIYAGTNQIQRNIIAERILGLPRK
jgi:alkylation response protein AidB-like acyl-CoA dehydrogenase